MVTSYSLKAAAVVTALLAPLASFAATIAIPIDLADQQAPLGHYLAADYDFGTTFSHVKTMTLEFRLADGYTSVAVGYGSSSYFRWLRVAVDEPGKQFVTDPTSLYWPSPTNTTGVRTTIGDVPPNTIYKYETVFGPEFNWPGALTGRGRVALIDISETWFGSLNFGNRPPEASWSSLTGIDAVRLIVDGTPTPEPSTLVLVAIACIVGVSHSRKM